MSNSTQQRANAQTKPAPVGIMATAQAAAASKAKEEAEARPPTRASPEVPVWALGVEVCHVPALRDEPESSP